MLWLLFVGVLVKSSQAQFCEQGFSDLNQGTPCPSDDFCRRLGGGQFSCRRGFCCAPTRARDPSTAFCRKAGDVVEMTSSGALKNCLPSACSSGFQCEYNYGVQQYICCGHRQLNDATSGTVRLYPGSNQALECFSTHQCLWSDTPNCVFSAQWNHNVCCSSFNC